ncbi:MAG: hypothetical protein P4L33_19675 [Capsulimonadaceae bacterium]|nr:hypothetical protein [Capsulimonadaceae bacterium]
MSSLQPNDLYPKNHSPKLSDDLFANPTSEYRGAPFWSWNTRLDIEALKRQIAIMKEMGFGGYHIHSRTGLDTPYLGEDFMKAVVASADFGETLGMLTWLYDEDRWPSGAGGGLVTKDHRYRQKWLRWTATSYEDAPAPRAPRGENPMLFAAYEVVLLHGRLARYRRLPSDPNDRDPQARIWYAYLETSGPSSWYNNEAYVDTFSREAIERFIEVTHERYAETVGDRFGKSIFAIFTDEPQFARKQTLPTPESTNDVVIPFTGDFFESYFAKYDDRLDDHLPELFWELPAGRVSPARYRYHDHIAERFAEAFADTVGDWCQAHGIALTGHMMEEPTLLSQTESIGDAMRSLRSFQIPGIDMLCDGREFTTAKQAQSIAHQYNRPAVVSELYGVTNWDFDFIGHKAQGDWQAALGVSVRVPHLAWVSMRGEAKRDYPAAIGYQSPWATEYKLIENHFARVATVLTRGTPRVRVGVIHPIESYWLCYGPAQQTRPEREERDKQFQDLTQWLVASLVDFDFIAESLLPSQCPLQEGDRLHVGSMGYEVVIVPGMRTIRGTTMIRLERFANAGGHVVFAGETPAFVDAEPSDRPARLAEHCARVDLTQTRIYSVIEPYREISALLPNGTVPSSLVHQVRQDGQSRHVFLVNTDRAHELPSVSLRFRGEWNVTARDTVAGTSERIQSRLVSVANAEETSDESWTEIIWTFPAHGHLLATLEPGWSEGGRTTALPAQTSLGRFADPVPVTLSEPNVLLLDLAEWRIETEAAPAPEWRAREEVLRIGDAARNELGLPVRRGHMAQPWTEGKTAPVLAHVALRFMIESAIDVSGAGLAIEEPEQSTITLDGVAVPSVAAGWWVDEDIKTVALPSFAAGTHELVIRVPVSLKSNLEWFYLLGDFGVEVRGSKARIVEPVRELSFGDWTRQGLPFYAGNVTYHLNIEADGAPLSIQAAHFMAPLLSLALDGESAGKIAFAPFAASLGSPAAGAHRLDITAFGNRFNAFGQLHLFNPELRWYGPDSWRTTGTQWAYEYQIRPMGLLTAPEIKKG